MTEHEDTEWPDRLARAVAETIRRRQARRQERAEKAERRAAGLQARHTRKLAQRPTQPTAAPDRPEENP